MAESLIAEGVTPVPYGQRVSDLAAILAVDDNPNELVALDATLAPLGQPIVRAQSGEDALRQLLRGDFAVILLDVRMSGMSGLETARLIKARTRTRLVPIIFLTGVSDHEETQIARGYSAGAVDYVFKPVQPEILRSKVSVFVELHRQQRRLALQERRLREADRRELELRHAQELLRSEREYREILEAAFDAIVIFDAAGNISMINHAGERMFGVNADEAVGTPVAGFFADEGDRSFRIDGSAHGDGGDAEGRPPIGPRAYVARRANGETFPTETSISCLDGLSHRYTLIVRDVSERVRQERSLHKAMSARSRFFAAVSHELRTPMNATLGFHALLLDGIHGSLNEKQTKCIQRAQRATRHLLELVNDLLDLSKIEAGKLDVHWEQFDVHAVVDDVVATVQPIADENSTCVTFEHPGEQLIVTSDRRYVHQIVLNLLSNAIKFGLRNPIRVVARSADESVSDRGAVIEVVDHGIGLAPEEKERIFQEFEQVESGRDNRGTGLGLPISRRLAERLGGTLEVESEPSTGSTFRLWLPSRPAMLTETRR
jgi:PAS domain S-box-containing protein